MDDHDHNFFLSTWNCGAWLKILGLCAERRRKQRPPETLLAQRQQALGPPLVFLNMPTMQRPEAYICNVADLLDDDGRLKTDGTHDFLKGFIGAFAGWIEKTKG